MSRPDVVASCETAKRIVDALLMATSEDVHEKLTRLDKGQPGSVLRSLRLTRDRLTGERGSEIMLKGPTAERLTLRVNDLVGNVGLVGASVFDLSEEDREHANRAPVALSIPLRDELVRASSTLARLLGTAVELRNWRENKEAELASLVETSDPAVNAIHYQRRVEIAGEIALVNQRETELLGDVYEVSNAVRRGLEERTHLLSNLIRLGLGSIPKSQVIFQPFTAEQLANLPIEARAEVWLRMTPNERAAMIETGYAVLRNLDGLPLGDREKMQELYIRSVISNGPEELRRWLLEMGFVTRDGELVRRFVMLDLDNKTYVTVHGCTSYEDIQLHLEGTDTKPSDPDGTGNLDKLDKKAKWRMDRGGCTAHLLYRNANFDQWKGKNTPWLDTQFSEADVKAFNNFVKGAGEAGDGSKYFDTRFHSAGNGMVPDFSAASYVDRIVMDDAAINAWMKPGRKLPEGPIILKINQEGIWSLLIRVSDQIPESMIESESPIPVDLENYGVGGTERVTRVSVPKTEQNQIEEDRKWIEQVWDPSHPLLKPVAAVIGLYSWTRHEVSQFTDRVTAPLNPFLSNHSDGWTSEWQWLEEDLRRKI